MKLEPGQRIGADFRLVARLGRRVWAAERVSNAERVAIKLGVGSTDPEARARFVREARRTEGIASVHVLEALGFGLTEAGVPYVIMELLEGETLADRLAGGRVLAPERALTVIRQVASALDSAHEAGVVHGNLEPSCIFLQAGDVDRIKVLDFELDEEAHSEGAVRRDLRALAEVAYRSLVAGAPAGEERPPPSRSAKHLPRRVDRVFQRAFDPRPGEEYRSAESLLADLEDGLSRQSAAPPVLDWLLLAAAALAAVLGGALLAHRDGF